MTINGLLRCQITNTIFLLSRFFQQYGFNIPLLFKDKTGLGLSVPSDTFTVRDVRMCVGSKRKLDVMDVNTQKNVTMTMKEWQEYYDNPVKEKLQNVISLEFSHTKLDHYVQSPAIVRLCDWVDVVWPKQLKEAQVEGTNVLDVMMYPKVQKYCLMSVKNCYTDFHVDFGGTSVWYHILRGSKVFWLIPPTDKNLQLYEKWVLSGKQSDVFFGDTVDKCVRVYLTAGNTFFIPTGWIHAVYTPTDSLVFGGNFLHSFGILKQLKIAQVEDSTKVPQKFRYPFFTEMLWYVLARYVYRLLGRSHLEGELSREAEAQMQPHVHLTLQELYGLKDIVMYLYDLPSAKKNVPELIRDPVALIKDMRCLVERHCKDSAEAAVTGVPILHPDMNCVPQRPTVIASTAELVAGDACHGVDGVVPTIVRENGFAAAPAVDPTTPSTVTTTTPFASPQPANAVPQSAAQTPPSAPNAETAFVSPQSVVSSHRTGPRGPYKKHKDRNSSGGGGNDSASNGVGGIGAASSTTSATDTPTKSNGTASGTTGTNEKTSGSGGGSSANAPRRRRTRCKTCAACQRSDCGECSFCLDMVKFGGPGRAKQTCTMRQCLQPMLPVTAQCVICHLDGWRQTPVSPQAKQQAGQEGPSALMECSVCYEIAHPDCSAQAHHQRNGGDVAAAPAGDERNGGGVVNEDLPNSWECPTCCSSGKNSDYKVSCLFLHTFLQ